MVVQRVRDKPVAIANTVSHKSKTIHDVSGGEREGGHTSLMLARHTTHVSSFTTSRMRSAQRWHTGCWHGPTAAYSIGAAHTRHILSTDSSRGDALSVACEGAGGNFRGGCFVAGPDSPGGGASPRPDSTAEGSGAPRPIPRPTPRPTPRLAERRLLPKPPADASAPGGAAMPRPRDDMPAAGRALDVVRMVAAAASTR